jgi:hypothetical protein
LRLSTSSDKNWFGARSESVGEELDAELAAAEPDALEAAVELADVELPAAVELAAAAALTRGESPVIPVMDMCLLQNDVK